MIPVLIITITAIIVVIAIFIRRQRKRIAQRLGHSLQASPLDPQTGLYTDAAARSRLFAEVERARRFDHPLTVGRCTFSSHINVSAVNRWISSLPKDAIPLRVGNSTIMVVVPRALVNGFAPISANSSWETVIIHAAMIRHNSAAHTVVNELLQNRGVIQHAV